MSNFIPQDSEVSTELDVSNDVSISEMIKRRIDLDAKRKELEGEAKAVKSSVDEIDTVLFNKMTEEGISSLKCHGKTVYKTSQVSLANSQGTNATAMLLLELGMPEFVTVNTRGLCSFLKEKCDERGLDILLASKVLVMSSPAVAELTKDMSEQDRVDNMRAIHEKVVEHMSVSVFDKIGMRKA